MSVTILAGFKWIVELHMSVILAEMGGFFSASCRWFLMAIWFVNGIVSGLHL